MRRVLILAIIGAFAAIPLALPFTQPASALGGSFDWATPNYNGQELNDLSNGANGIGQGISSDGRYVLFNTAATDAVANDTNGYRDVFMRDRQTDTTTLVSVGNGGVQGNSDTYDAAISGDGRYVVFASQATNFVSPDYNNSSDVFLRDTQQGTTTRICTGIWGCGAPSISRDGRYITYSSGDPFSYGGIGQVFRYDRINNEVALVTQTSDGDIANRPSPSNARMSADGRYVTFESFATNLVPNDTDNQVDIFRRDMDTGEIMRVNTTTAGVKANSDSQWPSISDDGRYITFTSVGSNLAANDNNTNWDMFLKDMNTGTLQPVGGALNQSQIGAISGDGSKVVFQTLQSFTATDTDSYQDVYQWDRAANTNSRLTELPNGSELGFWGNGGGNTSIDGRYTLIFTNNSIDAADNNPSREVYVYDRGPATPTNLTAASPTMKPALTWNAVAGATSYKVYRNGTNIATTTAPAYTDNSAPDGTVSYYVTAVENGVEGTPSNTIQVVVDTVRPNVAFTSPASFAGPFTAGPNVTVAANDTGSGLRTLVIHVYTSSNQLLPVCGTATPAQLSAGTMSCDLSSLPDGTYYIKAGSFDNAGNNRTINSGNFTITSPQ